MRARLDARAHPIVVEDATRSPGGDSGPGWLASLFRAEHARMSRFLRTRVGDSDAAADLLQDAYVRLAWSGERTPPKKPAAYLQRVLRNLVVDRTRRAHRDLVFLPLDDCDLPPHAPEQEHAIAVSDLMKRYSEALDTLSARTRQVFLLHRVDELTYAEIARRLGITVATVEYHMSRALVHLDEALGE